MYTVIYPLCITQNSSTTIKSLPCFTNSTLLPPLNSWPPLMFFSISSFAFSRMSDNQHTVGCDIHSICICYSSMPFHGWELIHHWTTLHCMAAPVCVYYLLKNNVVAFSLGQLWIKLLRLHAGFRVHVSSPISWVNTRTTITASYSETSFRLVRN